MSHIYEITEQIKAYMPKADIDLVNRAFVFATHAHSRQRRSSGEMYITHPLAVAQNLVNLKLDVPSIITGLLHDTVEDTHVTLDDINQRFGKEIAELVDGVTKVGKIHSRNSEHQKAENFRKMIMATAQDLRVLIIKLADRLHNMHTLNFVPDHKRLRIAVETMEIYAPLAHRLGIHWVAQQMEDLSFRYIEPEASLALEEKLADKLNFLKETQVRFEDMLQQALSRQGIDARVQGRMKNLYSLHQKMQLKSIDFEEIYDLIAFRIIVPDAPACYHALGIIHGLYHPIPGRFKDYIALPKANGYQSLHTAVIGPDHFKIEVQVRTEAMHQYAEFGVASHWLYKARDPKSNKDLEGFKWLKQMTDMFQSVENPGEFLENVRLDLYVKEVYVFSRDGDLVALPRGSRALDFAYAVHTDVGNHCIGIRVNGVPAPFEQKLANGDQVEVLTSPEQTPSHKWLQIVKTSRARQQIKYWLREQEKHEAIRLGDHLLAGAIGDKVVLHDLLRITNTNSDEELKEKLGRGDLDASVIRAYVSKHATELPGRDRYSEKTMQAASCCYPIPGDPVFGVFEKGAGFMIHHAHCKKVVDLPADKCVEVDWKPQTDKLYKTTIEVFCQNERGSLGKVTSRLSEQGVNIEDIRIEQRLGSLSSLFILVEVEGRLHLSRLFKALKGLPHVARVQRRKTPKVKVDMAKKSGFSAMIRGVSSIGKTMLKLFSRHDAEKKTNRGN